MNIHRATARNFSVNTENRIHSDAVAARFGFQGALVPGVAVFGHMTRPLVATLGTTWLANYQADVRFLKPAYHGDALTIRHAVTGDEHLVECESRGVLLAELRSRPLTTPVDGQAVPSEGPAIAERPEIHWDNVHVGAPFPSWTWIPDAVANAEAAAQVDDDLACYQDDVLHPHAILAAANRAFTRRYHLPAWLHVGSSIRFRKLLRVGDAIEVRATPTRKWRRKGHAFVDLDIAYLTGGEVAAQIVHTSIFAIAERG